MTLTVVLFAAGCAQPVAKVPETQAGRYLQVTLQRTGDVTRLISQDELQLAERPPAIAGDELLVGWHDGKAQSVAMVMFDTVLRGEIYDPEAETGASSYETVDDPVVTVTLDATTVLDKVTLIRSDGTQLLEFSPELATTAGPLKQALRADQFETPLPRSPGLKFLTPAGASVLPAGLRVHLPRVVAFSSLSAEDRAKVLAAFDGPNDRTLSALSMVALGDFEPGSQFSGWTNGGAAIFRLEHLTFPLTDGGTADPFQAVKAKKITCHEAAHAYTNLLSVALSPRGAAWPESVAAAARAHVDADLLGAEIYATWRAAHQSAADLMLAGNYTDLDWETAFATRQDALNAGFPTQYGSGNEREDIAELTAQANVVYPNSHDPVAHRTVCEQLQAAGALPPPRSLVLYFKLRLLNQLGLVDDARLAGCLGPYRVPNPGSGLHLMTDTTTSRKSFTASLVGGTKDSGARRQLVVSGTASDGSHLAMIARAPAGRPLIGAYFLDPANPSDPTANGFFYDVPTDVGLNRMSGRGLVIVTRADDVALEGLGLWVTLFSDVGPTETYPFVPFHTP